MAGININQNIFNYGELDETRHGATDNELYNHGLAVCKNVIVSDAGGLYSREGSVLVHYYTKRDEGGYIGRYKRDLHTYNLTYDVANDVVTQSGVLAIYPHGIELIGKHGIIAEKQNIDWLTSAVINKGYSIEQRDDALYMFCTAGIYEILYKKHNDNEEPELQITKVRFGIAPTSMLNNDPNNKIKMEYVNGGLGLQVRLTLYELGKDKFYDSDIGQNVRVYWTDYIKIQQDKDEEKRLDHAVGMYAWFQIDQIEDEHNCIATLLLDKSNILDSQDIAKSLPDKDKWLTEYGMPVFGEDRGGFPTKGCFFKNRVWIVDDANLTIYASHVEYGNLFNFYINNEDTNSGNNVESGLIYSIDATTSIITWIKGLSDKLIVGTLDGMYISNGASIPKAGDLISFNTISFVKFSSVSSGYTKPVQVNSVLLFVDYDGRTLYEVSVDNMTGAYAVFDLSQTSQHILRKGVAGSISYSTYPFNLITMPLTDGTFAMMTYNRGNEVYGWTRHRLGGDNPNVESVANLHYGSRDYIFMCVSRVVDGQIVRTIEYIENKSRSVVTEAEKYNYVDTSVRSEFKGHITNIQPSKPATITYNEAPVRNLDPAESIVVTDANINQTNNVFCGIFNGQYWRSGTKKIQFNDDINDTSFIDVPEAVRIYSGTSKKRQQFLVGRKLRGEQNPDGYVSLYLITDSIYVGNNRIVFTGIPTQEFQDILPLDNHNARSFIVDTNAMYFYRGYYYYPLYLESRDGRGDRIRVLQDIFNAQDKYECKIAQYYVSGRFKNGNNLTIDYQLPSEHKKAVYWKPLGMSLPYVTTKNIVCRKDEDNYTYCSSRDRIINNNILPAFQAGEDPNNLTSPDNFRFLGAISQTEFLGLHKSGTRLVVVTHNTENQTDVVDTIWDDFIDSIEDVYIFSESLCYVVTRNLNNSQTIHLVDMDADNNNVISTLQIDNDTIDATHIIMHNRCILMQQHVVVAVENNGLQLYKHPLGTNARCVIEYTPNENEQYVYVGGTDGLLYKLDVNDINARWRKVLMNNQINIINMQISMNNNDATLLCFSDIGDVLCLSLNDIQEETQNTITYGRSLVEIEGINSLSFVHNMYDTQSIAIVNSQLCRSCISIGNDNNKGYTNILNKNDKIRVSDVNYMPSLNNKITIPYLKVLHNTFDNNTGRGHIVCKRFFGDVTSQERYDKGQSNNGEIYFASNVIKGLMRFNGQHLRVVVDGRDMGDFTVQGDAIRLPARMRNKAIGFVRYAGYPYTKEIKTLNLTGGSVKGSSVGLIARQSTLVLRSYYSRGGEYSADGIKWYPITYENISAKYLDIPDDLYSGLIKMVMPNSTTDVTSRELWLRHSTAEPFNILSITRDTYVSDSG